MFRRIRRSLILGVGALLVLAGTVLAVVPTGWTDSPTDSRKIYGNPGVLETQRTLTWKFASTSYPTWFQNAIKTTLGTNWGHTAGASRMPKFSYNQTSGAGTVYYVADSTSPCTNGTGWLACTPQAVLAAGAGINGWKIYVRDLGNAPAHNSSGQYYEWNDQGFCTTSSPPAGTTKVCFTISRSVLHEAEHVTMGVENHDEQGEAATIMGSIQASSGHTGWNATSIAKCDVAAAQLWYGMLDLAADYANCFASFPGHGSVGLNSVLTMGSSSYFAGCTDSAIVSGRLALQVTSNYKLLSGNALAGRTVFFDRKLSSATTWTLKTNSTTASGASSNNFSANFGHIANGSYDYRAHFDGDTGVDPVTSATFSVLYSAAC